MQYAREDMQKVSLLIWLIWKHQNEVIFCNKNPEPIAVLNLYRYQLSSYNETNNLTKVVKYQILGIDNR